MENNNNNNKKRNKLHLALNCAIGSLALLGSVGTITFGTLWCQSRNNNGGGDTPTDEPITINLDNVQDYTTEQCYLTSSGLNIEKNQKVELVSKLSDLPGEVVKDYGLDEFWICVVENASYPTLCWGCELYVDDYLISPDLYDFYPKIDPSAYITFNLFWNVEEEQLPETFDINTSVFRVVITPFEQITSDATFASCFYFKKP